MRSVTFRFRHGRAAYRRGYVIEAMQHAVESGFGQCRADEFMHMYNMGGEL